MSLCGCIGGVPLLGYQDLSKWLPRWYIESCGCAAEPDSDDDVARSDRQKSSKCLSMLEWGIAFDHFSIAADAAGMWHYWESRAHLANCHKVAGMCLSLDMFFCGIGYLGVFVARAGTSDPKRRHTLAQFYDMVCRRDWADRSYRGELH